MQTHAKELRVGAFTLLGLVLLCVLVLLYGESPRWFWQTRWPLEILVNTPRGIGEGTPTFLQGVKVGRVDRIELKNPKLPSVGAAVIVEIEEAYDIPEGTRASLHPSFGFDKGAIHLLPPLHPSDPLKRDGAAIEGDTVGPLDAVVPQEFVEQLVIAVEQIGKVGAVADQLVEMLEPRDTREVDAAGSSLMANLSTTIQRADETLKQFNLQISTGGDIHLMLANLRDVTANFTTWSQNLEAQTERLVVSAKSAMGTMDAQVREVGERLAEVTDQMSKVADQVYALTVSVNEGQGTVGKLLHDPKLYEEMVDAIQALKLTLDDLRTLATWIETDSMLKRGL